LTPEKAEKILDQTKYETAPNTTPHRTFACFGCGSPEHPLKECPRKTAEEKKQFWNQYGRPPEIRSHQEGTLSSDSSSLGRSVYWEDISS